jgi:hypothetical protein
MSTIWLTARSQFLQRHRDALCLWTECDNKEGMRNRGSREDQRRRKCSTALKIPGLARRGAARSARDRLASSGTIRGELLFVQRSALNALRSDARKAVNGYTDSKAPKSGYRKSRGASRLRIRKQGARVASLRQRPRLRGCFHEAIAHAG